MQLPARIVDIVNIMYERNKELAHSQSDNDRRIVTILILEQIAFEFGSNWGAKARSADAPASKDGLAYKIDANTMHVWDWQNGNTREPQLTADQEPTYANLVGAHFIPANPMNHLGIVVALPPIPDETDEPVVSNPNDELERQLADIRNALMIIEEALSIVLDTLQKPVTLDKADFPDYEGKFKIKYLGDINFTLTPKLDS